MFERRISDPDVRHELATGQVIEQYPNDVPYPSYLMLGWSGTRPLHVVAADDQPGQRTIVITTYEPDPAEWQPDWRTRR
jgi:hypothetical protein